MHSSQDLSVSVYVLSQFHVVSPFIVVVPLMRVELILLTGTRV